MAEVACTQRLWESVMGWNPALFQSPGRPVESVTWDLVQKFIASLNDVVDGLAARLPTEAEWEFACRAGATTASRNLAEIAWYNENSHRDWDLLDKPAELPRPRDRGTHPVAMKQANPWGLYDMLGNVMEWCADGPRKYGNEAVIDPRGPEDSGSDRIVRGGDWRSEAVEIRAGARYSVPRFAAAGNIGFRLCCD
jgi:formylglycine-generating enzyme required for sulfatase activity